ncbi:MAG: bacteriophage abortive infection AbiH family protein [Cycloclasticus sp.]
MAFDNLYIIGNGFDIYHGIPSRYSDFKTYLSDVESDLHDLVEGYIPAEEDWSDMEAALAEIDVDSIVDDASQSLMSYATEDWSDAYHHDYQYEVNKTIEGLSSSLKVHFGNWVRQLEIPVFNELLARSLRLPTNSCYLNFNYTSSLTDIYTIPRDRIFYIHGEAHGNDELVLGHAWNPVEIPSLNDVPDPESMDTRVIEGNEIINDYFGKTFKNSEKIIAENSNYFAGLSGLSKITVLGHSLSLVDERYFKEIVKNISVNSVQWIVTHYGDDEKVRHSEVLRRIGIPGSAVNFYQMTEL